VRGLGVGGGGGGESDEGERESAGEDCHGRANLCGLGWRGSCFSVRRQTLKQTEHSTAFGRSLA
jgi:hypothetical protein